MVKSQDEKPSNFQLGGEFGLGFFNPTDVNNYISNYLSTNGWAVQAGTSDMFIYEMVGATATYTFSNNIAIRGTFECAISPKVITSTNSNDSKTFTFTRISPGLF